MLNGTREIVNKLIEYYLEIKYLRGFVLSYDLRFRGFVMSWAFMVSRFCEDVRMELANIY